jgi:hypothetical protein
MTYVKRIVSVRSLTFLILYNSFIYKILYFLLNIIRLVWTDQILLKYIFKYNNIASEIVLIFVPDTLQIRVFINL